jgi:hypothetical protein
MLGFALHPLVHSCTFLNAPPLRENKQVFPEIGYLGA